MLGVSVRSGTSGSSSTWSEAVDLEVVDAIIRRASGATSFPLVYPAYEQVLKEHGLSSTTDSTYYHFLLKLGTIRATTWTEKWRIYQSTHPSSFPPKHVQSPDTPKTAPLRARVPFLASASSDLDEGFATPSERNGAHQHPARPSPRKVTERSRSLVGYTPTPSLLDDDDDESRFDTAEFEPPVRTSTPNRAYRRTESPDLPPYSVSDVSEILLDEEDSRLVDGLSTPKAYARDLKEGHVSESEEEEEEDGELKRRADEFFTTGLMGRCWDVWTQSARWIEQTTKRIDDARSTILLRQTLLTWQAQTERNLNHANTARAHDELYIQNQAITKWIEQLKSRKLQVFEHAYYRKREDTEKKATWGKWRLAVGQRRMRRWKLDMETRERDFVKQRKTKVMSTTLNHWLDVARDRVDTPIADAHFDDRILRQSFVFWLATAQHRTSLSVALTRYLNTRETEQVRDSFGQWQKRARTAAMGRQAAEREEGVLITRVWEKWRLVKTHNTVARDYEERRALRSTFKRWRHSLKSLRLNSRRADTMLKRQDQRLRHRTLVVWMQAERGRLLASVRENRLVRQAFKQWQSKRQDHLELSAKAADHQSQIEAKSLHNHFSRWRARLGKQQTAQLKAQLVNERNLQIRAISQWVLVTRKAKKDEEDADKARAFFLIRGVFGVWGTRLGAVKRRRWEDRRRVDEMKGVWGVWRERTAQSLKDRDVEEQIQASQNKRLLTTYLERWTEKVIEIREREFKVTQQRDLTALQNALDRWRATAKRVEEAKSLMRSHVDLKVEENLRNVLLTWRDRARSTKHRRLLADKSISEHTDRLLRNAFDAWRGALRERQLADVEAKVESRREDTLLFSVWDAWTSRSSYLKVVIFEKRRLKRLVWKKWRVAAIRADELRSAQAPRDRRLLYEVLIQWRERAGERVAARLARQRNRPRHSSGGFVERQRVVSPISTSPFMPPVQPISRRITPRSQVPESRRPVRSALLDPDPDLRKPESVYSEPAYSRLRSELATRRRGGTEEPEERPEVVDKPRRTERRGSGSELFRALKGTLPDR